MARRTFAEFVGTPLSVVYIAGHLAEAKKAERVLTEAGLAYAIRLEPFVTTSVMTLGEYLGAFLYVPRDHAPRCRELLEQHGLHPPIGTLHTPAPERSDGA